MRMRMRGWSIEFYEAQAHPVHQDRVVRLPLALLKGGADGAGWKLYFRGTSGHWEPYPVTAEKLECASDSRTRPGTAAAPDSLRLPCALSLIVEDKLGVFW